MKALVVEDDFITSEVMKEIMLAFGTCDVAENGTIALEKFSTTLISNSKYDIVFLDIMMPDMSGQEVLQHLRNIESENNILGLDGVKVVMTSALDDFTNIKTAFKSQCESYLVKPVDKDKILNILLEFELL